MKYYETSFLTNKLKSNTKNYNNKNGRNNKGRITAWNKGIKRCRLYRNIDLYRKSTNGIVVGLEYDPNRKAFLARIFNPDTKINNYILAPTNLKGGQIVRSNSEQSENGYSQKLRYVPTGRLIYNIPLKVGQIGQTIRAPGTFARLIKKNEKAAQIQLKSGTCKWFHIETIVSLGVVSNEQSKFNKLKKAGHSIWIGKKPVVRGVAMNPIDHPHGGGLLDS